MKTIKVIDLLNKIANGEEVPKKIRIIDVYTCDLIYDEELKDYSVGGNYYMLEDQFKYKKPDEVLNIEVKIIEEDKGIEKVSTNIPCAYEIETTLRDKLNEVIDELNKVVNKLNKK